MSTTNDAFIQAVQQGYKFKSENVKIGCGMLNGNVVSGADVFLPLNMMNRYGLIAGATGTLINSRKEVFGKFFFE